jgi:hypothetical protein
VATKVDIWNRALQKLGAKRVASTTEDSANARACQTCYDSLRQAELRAHPWSFSSKRASLPASATEPLFTKTNAFPLPADFLALLPTDPEDARNDLDWQIEGRSIITNEAAPLPIRYTYDIEDVSKMDALFREALATQMAYEMCEQITQSNTKKQVLSQDYDVTIRRARKANAIERQAKRSATDSWITCRS